MIIAVDFDGTLHDGNYPKIGNPKSGAISAMKKIKDDGHYIVIWTCREGEPQEKMIEWLKKKEIPYDTINDNNPSKTAEYKNNSRKVYADIYIDDKNILGIPSWNKIKEIIIGNKKSNSRSYLIERAVLMIK
ncbi:hypothetical protein FACS189451_10900 [Bacteroidia bacterium]|nr:hypothetical protein FACS189451_10900 [Bacteroidia bacterium]